ncbi:MAG: response regulator, partial [Lysobacteraceae bacterium]
EDDQRQRESIAHLIGDDDVEVVAVERGEEALRLLDEQHFDCMIIDLKLPDMDGTELLSRMSGEHRDMLRTARNRELVFEGRKVLLVDDDTRNIFALTSVLEQRGLTVEPARNGVEALEKLEAQSDIDIVLMDVMMPVMDGLEATRRIRADARWHKLPVIAITAKAMRDDQEQCRRAGANDYLAKPLDPDRLMSLLRVWLPAI